MKELPTSAEILASIPKLKNSDKAKVESLRDWTFEKVQILQDTITTYVEKTDYKEDPDVFQERLYRYHLLAGGMLGLVTALYERAYYLHFKELTENNTAVSATTATKLNAGDRDSYAKGEVSDIKGLKALLEEVINNLQSRLYGCRSNRKW